MYCVFIYNLDVLVAHVCMHACAGIRDVALADGVAPQHVGAVEEADVEAWLADDRARLNFMSQGKDHGHVPAVSEEQAQEGADDLLSGRRTTHSLFVYPAYDNYCGVLYPLRWVEAIRAKSTRHHKWLVSEQSTVRRTIQMP